MANRGDDDDNNADDENDNVDGREYGDGDDTNEACVRFSDSTREVMQTGPG